MRGYALWELVITLAFFAVVATVAARAMEVEASRPAPVKPAPPAAEIDPFWKHAVGPAGSGL
jgi:hypothetical protein